MYKNPHYPPALNNKLLKVGINYLTTLDKDLASIINNFGHPRISYRKPGFSTLLYIILEQQVSLASAAATFNKLSDATSDLNPINFLKFNDQELKNFGFSRQKTHYCRLLAKAVLDNKIDMDLLKQLNDDDARNELIQLKGVGKWTADIYLMFVLRRADIFPVNDLALVSALKSVKRLRKNPDEKRIIKISDNWKPWRSVAARILWHYYLSI
jgi:DNA-3-methyladenine glycosylase II